MRNVFCAAMTQTSTGNHLHSLRSATRVAQSFSQGEAMSLEPIRGTDLLAAHEQQAPISWLWDAMLAAGNITLLTSVWKAGKSSLLALLLAGRHHGGVLLGRMIEPGPSAIVSEEPAELWRRRARNLAFGPNLSLFCRPFNRTPT